MITIYHNPRCSKSREALTLVQQFAAHNSMAVNIVEYLNAQLSVDGLTLLQRQLCGNLREMMRTTEEEYAGLGLADAAESVLLQAICSHPKLLQRPIVVYRERAIVARPPELLNDFLQP